MITHTKTKLSLVLLASLFGLGSASGMNCVGKKKIYYLLDTHRKITGCLNSGTALPDDLKNLIGKSLLKTAPFFVMAGHHQVDIETALARAEATSEIVSCKLTQGQTLQTIKILPIKKNECEMSFVLSMSSAELGVASQEQSINRGLEELARKSPDNVILIPAFELVLSDEEYQETARERARLSFDPEDAFWSTTDYYAKNK